MKSLKTLLSAAFLAASTLISPIETIAERETIFNQIYPVIMQYSYGEKVDEKGNIKLKEVEEKVKIKASLDADTNTIYFSVYTQDYNRKNWIGTEEQYKTVTRRHTRINYFGSEVLVIRPTRVKIKEISQKTFRVPPYKWESELEPYEEKEISQLLIEGGDTILDNVLSGIPFLGKGFKKFIKDSEEKGEEYYEAILEKINEDYVYTIIPLYIPKKLRGYVETAREFAIRFDTGNTQDEIPISLWMKWAFGDPSSTDYASFSNKQGKLENILIKFVLNENKIKREELYPSFFHGSELMHLNIAKKNIEGTKSNPAIITIKNLEYDERQIYEEDKVLRIGRAEYILQGVGDSAEKDLFLNIIQFETNKDRGDFMERRIEELKYPAFYKESIFSFIEKPTIEEVLNPLGEFNEKQMSIYFDLILDYTNRTGMQIILSKNEQEDKKLLEGIKEFQINSEE